GASARSATGEVPASETAVAFVFADASAALDGALAELFAHEPAFRHAFDECQRLAGASATSRDVQCVAIEYALARLWTTWGVAPQIAMGHGAGAMVAAVVAGVLSIDDAIAVAASGERREAILRSLRFNAPAIPIVSTLTGDWLPPDQATGADYWIAALDATREPAPASDALQSLDASVITLAVSPAAANASAARLLGGELSRRTISTLRDGVAAIESIFCALAELWVRGVHVDWATLHAGERRARVPLPTYPFERKRYWVDPAPIEPP